MRAYASCQGGQRSSTAGAARRAPLVVRAISAPVVPSNPKPSNPNPKGRSVDELSGLTFCDKSGNRIKPMPVDYGFRSGAGRLYEDRYGEVPDNVWELATQNFRAELQQMRTSFRYRPYYEDYIKLNPPRSLAQKVFVGVGETVSKALGRVDEALEGAGVLPQLDPPAPLSQKEQDQFDKIRSKLGQLQLDNDAVARREAARIAATGGDFETPLPVKLPFLALCWVLDLVYDNRPIQKFWVLETVARIPYMAYVSVLHLYETIGFWRAGAELRKVHFAEEWNEMHHLQIMESLGGDQAWFDRFLAQHAAVAYYWLLIGMYLVSPKLAYNFMRRVEHHASDTYCEFLEANREVLASVPPPKVALAYYRSADLYLFDEFQTGGAVTPRRPECNNLLDVFINIRDDEDEHVKTMIACQTDGVHKVLQPGQSVDALASGDSTDAGQ